jgi:FkbM family methyltransferase
MLHWLSHGTGRQMGLVWRQNCGPRLGMSSVQIPLGRLTPLWRKAVLRAFGSRSIRRTIATPDGRFEAYVSPGCELKMLDPRGVRIDAVHQRFIQRWINPTSVVWDIGTNMGLFAFPAALKAHNGQVYGFEPDVDLAANMLRSIASSMNRSLRVSVLCAALGDTDGCAEFLIAAYSRSMNKLAGMGPWHDNLYVAEQERLVPVLCIDTLAKHLRAPDIIKIDVEGAEIHVLRGGERTIAAHRPVLLVEGPHELWPEMSAFYRSLDYVCYDGQAEAPVLSETPSWDTVAVPREKWVA